VCECRQTHRNTSCPIGNDRLSRQLDVNKDRKLSDFLHDTCNDLVKLHPEVALLIWHELDDLYVRDSVSNDIRFPSLLDGVPSMMMGNAGNIQIVDVFFQHIDGRNDATRGVDANPVSICHKSQYFEASTLLDQMLESHNDRTELLERDQPIVAPNIDVEAEELWAVLRKEPH
jgi:hypothetical protein